MKNVNEIMVSPDGQTYCYFDEKDNPVNITNEISDKLKQLVSKMRLVFGDDLIIDKSITKELDADIYEYIVEKAYETPKYIFEEVKFEGEARKLLLIAFNNFFFDKIK